MKAGISLSSSWSMATGHHSGLRDMELHGFKRHQCLILSSTLGETLEGTRGSDTKQREPSQIFAYLLQQQRA